MQHSRVINGSFVWDSREPRSKSSNQVRVVMIAN